MIRRLLIIVLLIWPGWQAPADDTPQVAEQISRQVDLIDQELR